MISIIMPTYNRAYIIERAIKSVLNQTYENWELIIVDDASTDETAQVVRKYITPKIHYYINNVNKGANVSRNIGVSHAQGDFLAFLDSDNYWPDYKLKIQMDMFEGCQNNRCFIYGKAQIIDIEDVRTVPQNYLSSEELKETEIKENVVDLNTILIKKRLFLEMGGFDEKFPRLQDWELVLRMLYTFKLEGIGCEKYLSYNEIQDNSIKRDDVKLVKAMELLFKKHICKYSNTENILDNLLWLFKYAKVPMELINRTVAEISIEDPFLLPITFKRLKKGEEAFMQKEEACQTSYNMEKLLYAWHKKNLDSRENTLFSRYFYAQSKIKKIAIYGLGKLGTLFYNEIKALPVKVVYGIDRSKEEFHSLDIKRPDEDLEQVDWIVVAMLKDCELTKMNLKNHYKGKIVTLEELIFGIDYI